MQQVIDFLRPVALPFAIVMAVIAGIIFFIATRMGETREVMRTLKAALDRDPSPAQIGQALQMYPQASQFPGQHQLNELRRLAREDENKRARTFEAIKGWSRVFLAFAVLGAAAFIGVLAWDKFGPKEADKPKP